jgi:hypothetical protein
MVSLGNANSRIKDFYDVWTYSNHLDFNTDTLLKAIDATLLSRSVLAATLTSSIPPGSRNSISR